MSALFDPLEYFEQLKSAGMPEGQARVQASALRDFSLRQEEKSRRELPTKAELRETEQRLQNEIERTRSDLKDEINGVRSKLKDEINGIRSELKDEIADTKHEILKWMVTAMIAQTALLVGIIAFLK